MLGLRNPRKKEKAKSSGEDSRVIGSFLEALEATHDSPIPVQQSNTQCFWAVVYLCYDRRKSYAAWVDKLPVGLLRVKGGSRSKDFRVL